MNRIIFIPVLFIFSACLFSQNNYTVNLSGNAYVTSHMEGAAITEKGLENWTSKKSVIQTYVYFHKPQTVSVSIKGESENPSEIEVVFAGKKTKIAVPAGNFEIPVSGYSIQKKGYLPIKLQGINKTGTEFAHIESFIIGATEQPTFVHDFSDYWGRRGPSVHLKYTMPKEPVEWFYNEITVPRGNDIIGSYYMANGFGQGYFGMQCNSPSERRVLFSVWSPFDTEDPKLIPDSLKIRLLRKGADVHIGEFGNEGSGGQSFLRYNWKAGKTYKFLTQIKPDGNGNTVYTAYFFAADEGKWRLIASFLRPQTNTHYTGAYSFLENFIITQGYLTRRVLFTNQWFRSVSGNWIEADEATFTYDATAAKQVRLDYGGGYSKKQNAFYLQNCGFFNQSTEYQSKFLRTRKNKMPVINLEELQNL